MKLGRGEVGGLYGINVETLTGNKALTVDTDEIYQYLDEGGADRLVTLATAGASAGDRFIIRHNGAWDDSHNLEVKQAAVTLDRIYASGVKEFVFDGTNWVYRGIGTGETGDKAKSISIGYQADGSYGGVAVGYTAKGRSFGVALGYAANAEENGVAVGQGAVGGASGVAIGYSAQGNNFGVAVGRQAITNSKIYSIALGYRSECERVGETSVNINSGDSDQENNVVQGRWEGELAGGAGATEIFCAGQANERFTIRASSVLAFKMKIVARDNVANEVAMYTVEDGLIKRDGANNTVMVNCTLTVIHEDDAAWDCAVTADDANEALIITVTGDGVNITQWAAVMDGVETHF